MEEIIRFDHVTFSYEGHPILQDVHFTIHEGEFISIIGPNGGGKTTLAKLMLGLIAPNSGEVKVFGTNPLKAAEKIGYVPQYSTFDHQFPVNVLDVTLMGRLKKSFGFYSREDKTAAFEAIKQVGLQGLEREPFANLSGGQRQRVLIARALAGAPKLLLMDEPTASVDTAVENRLKELLKELHKHLTIILITHDFGFITHEVDKLVCVNKFARLHEKRHITPEMIENLYGGHVHHIDHTSRLGAG